MQQPARFQQGASSRISTPSKGSFSQCPDRFIQPRSRADELRSAFDLLHRPSLAAEKKRFRSNKSALSVEQSPYSIVLKSELLVTKPSPSTASAVSCAPRPNIFRFSGEQPLASCVAAPENPFCITAETRHTLLNACRTSSARKISPHPFKILYAPCLEDDFYSNFVVWSSQNVLAIVLDESVFLAAPCTNVITELCEFQFDGPVGCLAWNQMGTQLAVGFRTGNVHVWDVASGKHVRTMKGHTAGVGALAWNSSILASGSSDKIIYNRDMRCKEPHIARLSGHEAEVCGLQWSLDEKQLASGGNDKKLLIWNAAGLGSGGTTVATGSRTNYNSPVLKFRHHKGAVKAIAWSPHSAGLLASGGGVADRKIRFWNTRTKKALAAIDTGSEVCNLAWSNNVNELVSTHGFRKNEIVVWKYPTIVRFNSSCRKHIMLAALCDNGIWS